MSDIKLAAFIEVYGILAIVGTMVWMLVDELRQRSPWGELIPSLLSLEPRLRPERAPPAVTLLRTHGQLLTGYSRRVRIARHGRRVRRRDQDMQPLRNRARRLIQAKECFCEYSSWEDCPRAQHRRLPVILQER